MVNKKVVFICTVITIIVVAAIIGISIKKTDNINYEQERPVARANANITTNNTIQNDTQLQNEAQENTVVENDKVEQTEKTEPRTEVQGEEETKVEENTENNDDKALKLAKEEWGEDDSVYYTIDNHSKNIYNISIRSKSSTATVAEYEVNVETGEVKSL